eukprot:COSAG02_NODE_509_length_20882_cov_71.811914_6_plen_69_part_00
MHCPLKLFVVTTVAVAWPRGVETRPIILSCRCIPAAIYLTKVGYGHAGPLGHATRGRIVGVHWRDQTV